LKRIIILLLIASLLFGCIKGSVPTEKNETKNESIKINETKVETLPKEKVVEAKPKERFLPWETGFKDLNSFYLNYYYVKSGYIDGIEKYGSVEAIPEQPSNGIIKIWFLKKGALVRIDRYDEDYLGKGFCKGSPTEFMEYEGKKYALVGREFYRDITLKQWQHAIITKTISNGSSEEWNCEMEFSSGLVANEINNGAEAIEAVYNLYANKYAKPNYYRSEEEYDKEVEQVKRDYDEYYARDGARYVKETNTLQRTEQFADREVVKFYVTKDWNGYGYELSDKKLGLGLAFYIEKFKDIKLEKEFLVYKLVEFDEEFDKSVFDLG